MALELEDFLITGRTFEEYAAFFDLRAEELIGKKVLDCPGGASSFVAELRENGIDAHACDLLYRFEKEAILSQGLSSIEKIYADTSWMQDNRLDFYGSVERHRAFRANALHRFYDDYDPAHYRYAELPKLPYDDRTFDILLSSHLLFVYDDRLDIDFHIESVREMLRIAPEVRIFPLIDFKNSRADAEKNLSPYAYEIAEMFGGEIIPVNFEFQKNGGYMMRIESRREIVAGKDLVLAK